MDVCICIDIHMLLLTIVSVEIYSNSYPYLISLCQYFLHFILSKLKNRFDQLIVVEVITRVTTATLALAVVVEVITFITTRNELL